MASVPSCSFLRAFGSKNGGLEATATTSRILGKVTHYESVFAGIALTYSLFD